MVIVLKKNDCSLQYFKVAYTVGSFNMGNAGYPSLQTVFTAPSLTQQGIET